MPSSRPATGRRCSETLHHRSGGDTMTRRVLVAAIALIAVVTMLAGLPGGLTAQGKVVKIGLSLPLTGPDADGAGAPLKAAQMAIAEHNPKDAPHASTLQPIVSTHP